MRPECGIEAMTEYVVRVGLWPFAGPVCPKETVDVRMKNHPAMRLPGLDATADRPHCRRDRDAGGRRVPPTIRALSSGPGRRGRRQRVGTLSEFVSAGRSGVRQQMGDV